MSRRFNWWEAERELPRLRDLLREALDLKTEYSRAEQAVRDIGTRVTMLGGVELDRRAVARTRQQRDHTAGRLKQALEGIQETGCVVKDLDVGLLDFPTVFQGREVYLCWKLGEPSIGFWHGTEEGFAGRRPIDDEFLANHAGE